MTATEYEKKTKVEPPHVHTYIHEYTAHSYRVIVTLRIHSCTHICSEVVLAIFIAICEGTYIRFSQAYRGQVVAAESELSLLSSRVFMYEVKKKQVLRKLQKEIRRVDKKYEELQLKRAEDLVRIERVGIPLSTVVDSGSSCISDK